MQRVVFIFLVLFILVSCTQQPMLITGRTVYQGVTQQKMQINNQIIICFSEIQQEKLSGIYCQSESGFTLFSAGYNDNKYQIEVISRFLLPTAVDKIILYAEISIFSAHQDIVANQYTVYKKGKLTDIYDHQKKLVTIWIK